MAFPRIPDAALALLLGSSIAGASGQKTETKFHSLITIDGKGEGFFAPPARWIGVSDAPAATFASMDTKYCYDWRWMKPSFLATEEQLKEEPWLEVHTNMSLVQPAGALDSKEPQ